MQKDILHRRFYAIFRRNKHGKLVALIDASTISMGWSDTGALLWSIDQIPNHYFRPQDGHFIVCTSRRYPDLEFTGKRWAPRKRNWEWYRKDK